jgi:ClpP class serine protease
MRLQRILNAVFRQPWNITADGHESISQLLKAKLDGVNAGYFSEFVNERPGMEIDRNSIAHVYVCGVLGQGLTQIERSCGNTDYSEIINESLLAAETGAKGIMYHHDSPGGMATGAYEAAKIISELGLPTMAYGGSMMCSASYQLASVCNLIWMQPSGLSASIGTIMPMIDSSERWKMEGVKPDYITHAGGDLKAAGYPPSMTPEQRASLQELVDDAFEQFSSLVLANRAVPKEAMRGQVMGGKRCLKMNVVDGLGSEAEAYQELLKII